MPPPRAAAACPAVGQEGNGRRRTGGGNLLIADHDRPGGRVDFKIPAHAREIDRQATQADRDGDVAIDRMQHQSRADDMGGIGGWGARQSENITATVERTIEHKIAIEVTNVLLAERPEHRIFAGNRNFAALAQGHQTLCAGVHTGRKRGAVARRGKRGQGAGQRLTADLDAAECGVDHQLAHAIGEYQGDPGRPEWDLVGRVAVSEDRGRTLDEGLVLSGCLGQADDVAAAIE